MEPYLGYLQTYMSLSGPHLGYWYSSNSLFNSGLWILKKLKGAQCIHQLTFTDDPDFQNTFFYKLCKVPRNRNKMNCMFFALLKWHFMGNFQKKTLHYFENIVLLSSPQVFYQIF